MMTEQKSLLPCLIFEAQPSNSSRHSPRILRGTALEFFEAQPSNSSRHSPRILRGTALEFFEPSVLDPPEDCDWLEDWSAFVRILRKDFGPIDPAADAEDSLDNLKSITLSSIV